MAMARKLTGTAGHGTVLGPGSIPHVGPHGSVYGMPSLRDTQCPRILSPTCPTATTEPPG